ncbi:restriction endonuclease subunit S [uncultured Cytophaga sp.]|uniref:restriction endonuclease subunit S n=1 Tax=uncultured Cytophaga sp. TaxID=160238 RepID=UPI00261F6B9F|nr:restriction endonuclease subunit S [uncultured Cytophaga sp.]
MSKVETLKDITLKIGSGATPPGGQNSYYEEGVSFIRSQNVLDFRFSTNGLAFINEQQAKELNVVTIEENDILLNITGDSIARVCLVPKEILPARVNQHVAIIRCDETVYYKYVYYYLLNLKPYLLKICGVGGTRNALTKVALEKLEIIFHDNQKRRAEILSALDSKIELNNRINAELEAMAKTLYDYWFVQFDFPNEKGKPYKSSGGKMVWNDALKREVPAGWEVTFLNEWINNDKSGDWGKEAPEGNYNQKVYCVRGADINGLNGNGSLNTPERYILEKNIHKILEPADLIVEISGGSPTQSTGRLAFVTDETLNRFDAPLICSNFCKAVTLKDKKLLFNFVYHWNSIYDAGVLFGYEGKTSGIKNLLFESFVSTHLTVLPTEDIIEKFYKTIVSIHSKKQTNLLENQKLAQLRDWLLPMLMNGQVKVV